MSLRFAGAILGCGEDDASVRAKQDAELRRAHPRGNRPVPHETDDHPYVYLNHGRWLVDCPCGSGAAVTTTGKAYCCECGRIMTVELPDVQVQAEAVAVFGDQKIEERNWHPVADGALSEVRATRALGRSSR